LKNIVAWSVSIFTTDDYYAIKIITTVH